MMLAVLLLAILVTFTLAQIEDPSPDGRWFNPPNPIKKNNFSSNPVYTVGSVEDLRWTTVYTNYTIVLWQAVCGKPEGRKGPVIFQTDRGAVTQFSWVVQSFEFDLKCPVFFLWLQSGSYADNGDTSVKSVTSRHFNLTLDDSKEASSSVSVIITPSQSSTSSKSADSTSIVITSSSPTTTTVAITSTATTQSFDLVLTSTSLVSSSTATAGSDAKDGKETNGITIGAQVGIGLGAVIGISLVALIGMSIMWYLRRKRRATLLEGQFGRHQSSDFTVHSVLPKRQPEYPKETCPMEVENVNDKHYYINEVQGDYSRPPAELC